MRLDHLLSKEHFWRLAGPGNGVGVGAQSRVLSECLGTGLLMWVERWHCGTGCEIGGAAHCWVLREQASTVCGGCPFGGSCGLAVIITVLLVASALVGVVVGSRWVVMAGPSVL